MKYLHAALLALLLPATLLSACSQEETLSIENPPTELSEEETTSLEAEIDEASGSNETETDTEKTDEAEIDAAASDEESNDDKEDSSDEETSDTEGVEQKNVKLEVNNQQSFGQIKVKTVATSRDGWVSVHKSKDDGSIVVPESIGEARVDSGDSEDVIIDLWEAPAVGEKLWVLLHIDAGERGQYEFPGEDLPVKRNGETMARSLVIQGEEKEEGEEAE